MVGTTIGQPVAHRRRRLSREHGLHVAVLLGIVMIGLAKVPVPLGGDQALNLLMAQVIHDGGAPYRDLWDLKHPGIFFFFAAGGTLLGFDEIGIHLFELLWMVLLAVLVGIVARSWLDTRPVSCLAPLLTVGFYYAVAGERLLTQTEALVGLPLLASLWCAQRGIRSGSAAPRWLFASGVAAGVVMVFKVPYVALPAVFWVLIAREATRGGASWRALASRSAPWLAAGALLPVLATLAYLLSKDAGGQAFWTFFRHPAEVGADVALDPRRLVHATRAFLVTFAPVVALAAIGLAAVVLRRRRDAITTAVCAWLLGGVLLIGIQITSWWDYHFLLLLVPAGLLAARGVDALGRVASTRPTPAGRRLASAALALALVLIFLPQIGAAAQAVRHTWETEPLAFSRTGVAAYQRAHHPDHASIRARAAFLREPDRQAGPIYAVDLPTYYVYAGRRPAVPWLAPWFHPTDRLWRQLLDDLQRASPPYVRLSDWGLQAIVDQRPQLAGDIPQLVALVEARYDVLRRDDAGAWYVRRHPDKDDGP